MNPEIAEPQITTDTITSAVQNSHSFVISQAIGIGRTLTKKYFWAIMLLGAITALPSLISNLFTVIVDYIPGATEIVTDKLGKEVSEPTTPRSIAIIVVMVIGNIIGAWLGIGMTRSYLMILQDTKPTIKDLCVSVKYLLRLIGASIIQAVLIILGLLLFIFPGIYISIRLGLFQYFIAEGYGIMGSINASRAATKGQVRKLISINFIYIGIVLLGLLALGIGLFWAIPTIILVQAYIYTQLKKNTLDTFRPIYSNSVQNSTISDPITA